VRNSTTDFSAGQATDITSHDGHQALVPAQAANRFERPESYTAVLQRQNVALQIEVASYICRSATCNSPWWSRRHWEW
jgi:hypothetical protein